MQYIKGIESYQENDRTAVTLGKFDGLHRGHQKLVEQVRKYAGENVRSVVFSFDMQPFFKERGMERKILMTNEERRFHLEGQVDYLIECPFTEAVHGMEAEDFIKDILVDRLHAEYIVVGTDFRFGHHKRGDAGMLRKYEDIYGYHLDVIEKEIYENREISSTFIKEEVEKGNMELAENLLGYPYTIEGTVVHGRELGRTLGFPTMNIRADESKLLPPRGVYVSSVRIQGKVYTGISNVGCNPTVSDKNIVVIETFLFDYAGDAYGEKIEVGLYRFVRPERKFASVEELKQRVNQDIECGKEYFYALQNEKVMV